MFIWQSETLFFDYWALMLFSGYSSQILRKSLKPMDGLQLSQNLQFCPQNSIFPWELLETPTFSFKLLVMKNCPQNNIYYCFSNNKIIKKKMPGTWNAEQKQLFTWKSPTPSISRLEMWLYCVCLRCSSLSPEQPSRCCASYW